MVIVLIINGWGVFEGCNLSKKLMNWYELIYSYLNIYANLDFSDKCTGTPSDTTRTWPNYEFHVNPSIYKSWFSYSASLSWALWLSLVAIGADISPQCVVQEFDSNSLLRTRQVWQVEKFKMMQFLNTLLLFRQFLASISNINPQNCNGQWPYMLPTHPNFCGNLEQTWQFLT